MPGRTRITADEYLRICADDPRRTELVDGEIVVVNHPRFWHGRVQSVLIHALGEWEPRVPGRAMAVGPTEVRLTDHDVYGPDLVIVRPLPELTDRDTLAQPPLIAVEIRSPAPTFDVSLELTRAEALTSPLLPGFSLALAELFERREGI